MGLKACRESGDKGPVVLQQSQFSLGQKESVKDFVNLFWLRVGSSINDLFADVTRC